MCCSGRELFRDIQTLTLFSVSQLAVASSQLSHYQAANLNNCITIWINLNFCCRGNGGQCPQQQVLHPEGLTVWEGCCFDKVGAKRMANSVGHCLFPLQNGWKAEVEILPVFIFVDVVIIVIIVFLFFPWISRMFVIFWKVTCYFTSVARCSEDQYLYWGWCWWCGGLEIVTVDGTMFFVLAKCCTVDSRCKDKYLLYIYCAICTYILWWYSVVTCGYVYVYVYAYIYLYACHSMYILHDTSA